MVWVNGYAIGRYWEIGPQQTLYVPGCWLKKGENEVIILDMAGPVQPQTEGLQQPILTTCVYTVLLMHIVKLVRIWI